MRFIKKCLKAPLYLLPLSFKNLLIKVLTDQTGVKNPMLENAYGYDTSINKEMPINASGEPLPWLTYAMIEFLEQFDLSEKDICEYGAGFSSMYFTQRCKSLCSIENDEEWFKEINSKNLPNHTIKHIPYGNDYPYKIADFNKEFDIILIDGKKRRYECCKEAVKFIKDGGVIILDNSDRWHVSAKYLREECGFTQIDFHGFGPVGRIAWTTSIFFKGTYNLTPKNDRQPKKPLFGIRLPNKDEAHYYLQKDDEEFGTDTYNETKKLRNS